jgi:hypothetical protein
VDLAVPLWQKAVRLEPRWALDAASLAMLTNDAGEMEAALALAPQSYLLALNAGVLHEANSEDAAAQADYARALELAPTTAAQSLFWGQTPLRQAALTSWQALQPAGTTLDAQGWAAFRAKDFQRASAIFQQDLKAAPLSGAAYLGLARCALAQGELSQADSYVQAGLNLSNNNLMDTLEFQLLRGDLANAGGDPKTARAAYLWAFGIITDYTSTGGPGTYGDATRSWWLFHREGLPSDLIPQLVRADVSAEIDTRLAWLAQSYIDEGQPDNACFILAHPHHEALQSESGQLFQRQCASAANP